MFSLASWTVQTAFGDLRTNSLAIPAAEPGLRSSAMFARIRSSWRSGFRSVEQTQVFDTLVSRTL